MGDLPRHADRAGRAGRRLLHDPRRRAAALRPADREAHDRHRVARRLDHGEVVPRASQGELPLHATSSEICEIMKKYDVAFSLGDGLRPGSIADANDEAQFARARDARRADADRVEARRAGDDRRPGPRADAHDQGEHGPAAGAVPRGAVLHARAARHRHRARLRPHHARDRRGDDRLVRHRDALLRDAEGAPRAARTSDDVKDGIIAYKIAAHAADLAKGHPGAQMRDDALSQGALRVPLGGPVQPVARSRHGARVPRRDAAAGRREGRALLLDVRPALLLDEDHAGRARLRGRRRASRPTKPSRPDCARRPPRSASRVRPSTSATRPREASEGAMLKRWTRFAAMTFAVAAGAIAGCTTGDDPGPAVAVEPARALRAQLRALPRQRRARRSGDQEDDAERARLSRPGVPVHARPATRSSASSWRGRARCPRSVEA